MKLWLTLAVLLAASGQFIVRRPVALIDASRKVDWSTAGVIGGIPTRTTQCGSTIAAYSGTAATINSAIASCASGQVVQLGSGTFTLSTGIIFDGKSNVTLRGAGPDATFLAMTGADTCIGYISSICVSGNGNWYGGTIPTITDWTAGYSVGTTQITVASASGISAGTVLALDQLDDTTDAGGVIVCDAIATTPFCARDSPAFGRTNRAQWQIVKVTAVNGTVLTITPGIHMPNWRSSQSPQGMVFGTNDEMDGVEGLSVDHTNAGGLYGIVFNNAYNCWLKNVRSVNGPRNHVWLIQSAHLEVRDTYAFASQNSASESYGIETSLCSDCLVINNILQHVTLPILIGNTTGSVYAYNYSIDNVYSPSADWLQPGSLAHDAGIDMFLLEGNDLQGFEADMSHGSTNFGTLYRNYFNGWQTLKTLNTIPIQLLAKHRYYNLIGNVVGRASYHTRYQTIPPSGTTSDDFSTFELGWSGQRATGDDTGIPDDTFVPASAFRWGNYDTVNAAVRWVSSEVPSGLSQFANPVPPDHTLPSSLFLSGKPSFFGTVPWPAIGPEVSGGGVANVGGHVYRIPARICFEDVMGGPGSGSALTFNATGCYPVP